MNFIQLDYAKLTQLHKILSLIDYEDTGAKFIDNNTIEFYHNGETFLDLNWDKNYWKFNYRV